MESTIHQKLVDISLCADVLVNLLEAGYRLPDEDDRRGSILDGAYYLSRQLTEQIMHLEGEVEREEKTA